MIKNSPRLWLINANDIVDTGKTISSGEKSKSSNWNALGFIEMTPLGIRLGVMPKGIEVKSMTCDAGSLVSIMVLVPITNTSCFAELTRHQFTLQ